MWRLLYAIPSYIGFMVLRIVMILLGYITVPIATICQAYRCLYDKHKADKGENPYVFHFTWKWMYPWDNWEDGIANDMYWKAPNHFLQVVYWSCYRNPVNNLRRVPYLSVKIRQEKVRFKGSLDHVANPDLRFYDRDDKTFWYFCWHGFYSNFRVQWEMKGKIYRFWIGWKIYPEDSKFPIPETSHRFQSAGFGSQTKKCWPK